MMLEHNKSDSKQSFRRDELREELRQVYEQTLDERVDRYLEINHQGIIGGHHFSIASSECINLYRDGHFIAAVMVSQAVNEGILKFVGERNKVKERNHKKLIEILEILFNQRIISRECADASEKICKSLRNDVHHMNPNIMKISFQQLARQNIRALAVVEREIFGFEIEKGKLIPKQPKYWDIQDDGKGPVFLRLGI